MNRRYQTIRWALIVLVGAFLIAAILTACDKRSPTVGFATLEDARATARANAEFNAASYRAESPRMTGLKIVGHGDPAQTPDCPQGSGWAQLSLMNVDKERQTVEKYVVMCSTVSATIGCYLKSDFQNTLHAQEENRCNSTLPHPLPKLGK